MMDLPSIKNIDVKGKTVFVRADLDVPLSEDRGSASTRGEQKTEDSSQRTVDCRQIEDDTRLKASLPTIKYLLQEGAKVIVVGHLGRPGGVYKKELSLEPVAEWMAREVRSEKLEVRSESLGGFDGWRLGENLVLLENLRFYEGEEKNDEEFSRKLASLADIYVNEAFAMCHRNHASVVGITKFIPSYAGFHLTQEVEVLNHVLKNPDRPMVVVIGGVKIETKLPLVCRMREIADYVLVGGLIAQENPICSVKQNSTREAKVVIADSNKDKSDITEESILKFKEIIKKAKTIVWNGPLGKIDEVRSEKLEVRGEKSERSSERGTREVAEAIASSSAYKIAGGGDTTEYLKREGLTDKFDFVSTGGGAMLSFLSGENLPGLEPLIR